MEGSTKVKTNNNNIQQQDNVTIKAFSVGERVEAIWSSDGQKYPGRIVHVFPNDNYEVLFDDGVKSRRKANLIFKPDTTSTPPPPTISEQKQEIDHPPPPSLLLSTTKGRLSRSAVQQHQHKTKPLPSLLPANNKPTLSRQSSYPPPPPLLCGVTNARKSSIELLESSSNKDDDDDDDKPPVLSLSTTKTTGSDNKSPSTANKVKSLFKKVSSGPPSLIPKPKSSINSSSLSNSNNNVPVVNKVTTTNTSDNNNQDHDEHEIPGNELLLLNTTTNGSSSPLTINTSTTTTTSDSSTAVANSNVLENNATSTSPNSTKKGFVYVQQPHYSVFDPPPVDLGKRQRRVHNYSKLAKGPSLKKGLFGGDELLIDGEFITPTSTPSSSKPNSRCSSPSTISSSSSLIINNINSSTLLVAATNRSSLSSKQAPPLLSSHLKASTLPSGSDGGSSSSRFVRKRRFLKSPPKSTERPELSSSNSNTSSSGSTASAGDSSTCDLLPTLNPIDDTTNNTPLITTVESESTTKPLTTTTSTTKATSPAKLSKPTPLTSTCNKNKSLLLPNINSSNRDSTSSNNSNSSTSVAVIVKSETEFILPQAPPPSLQSVVGVGGTDNSEGELIPSKRLRKPSIRFSDEEGYVNIFSQQRRSRRSSPSTPPPALPPNSPTSTSPSTSPTKRRGRKPGVQSSSTSLTPPIPQLIPISSAPVCTDSSQTNSTVGSNKIKSKSPSHKKKVVVEVSVEDEEEELLDIGEYAVAQPSDTADTSNSNNKNKSPTKKLSRSSSSSSSVSKTIDDKLAVVESHPTLDVQSITETASATTSNNLVHQRPLRQTSRGRIVRPPVPKTETREPSIVLDRIAIPKVQVLVEKCDIVVSANNQATSAVIVVKGKNKQTSTHTTTTQQLKTTTTTGASSSNTSNNKIKPTSSAGLEKDIKKGKEDTMQVDDIVDVEEQEEEVPLTSSIYGKPNNKRWKNKKRGSGWGHKRGLLPGMKTGMRVNDSHAMQLLKRSRLQRRFDSRGRPKVILLKEISKKRLKKIQDSIKRRKLKRKKLEAVIKFKDVRVDIINCICGRTDEFGLMVQCEVCMCWQHGNCFGYFDGSTLPRFYVCQSCGSPKKVRPSHRTEGIRQESYKKGILPSYPSAPKSSLKQQRILKRCNDLTKIIHSIENVIRQNRLKELIATSEPEHKKLYQWSAPRAHPKDLIQKWQFNKYFKPVVRRLILKHKGKPDYMDKLANTVSFRDKLKKYGQAFEEAKLAISRKIGSRGLILVEKLSEQESKVNKIQKVKEKLDSELSSMPKQLRKSLLTQILDRHFPQLSLDDLSMSSSSESSSSSDPSNSSNKIATRSMIEEYISKFSELLNNTEELSFNNDNEADDFSVINILLSQKKKDELMTMKLNDIEKKRILRLQISPLKTVKTEPEDFAITNNENAELAEEIARFNLEQWQDVSIDDEDEKELTPSPLKKSLQQKPYAAVASSSSSSTPPILVDLESENGDNTSEGGEYSYNPSTQLNSQYDAMRQLLLHDPYLAEQDNNMDGAWKFRNKTQTLKRDWIDELDFYLNGDLGFGLDSISDSDDSSSSGSDETDSDDDDEIQETTKEDNDEDTSSDTDDSESDMEEEEEGKMDIDNTKKSLRHWQKALITTELNDEDDDDDNDWNVEEATDSEDEDQQEKISSTTTQPSTSSTSQAVVENNGIDMMFVSSSDSTETTANPGELIDVRLRVENKPVISKAIVIGGVGGENFVKLVDSRKVKPDTILSNFGNLSPSQLLLCKPCQESFGVKWTWKQLNSAKGVSIVLDDTLQTLATEVERCKQLGLCTLDAYSTFDLQHISQIKSSCPLPEESKIVAPPTTKTSLEPKKLTELCRDILSKPRTNPNKSRKLTTTTTALKPQQLASAEEESILTLLSLSKSPADCNGENVSELSIESLRKLTDRLQHNGPLSEDLAKAVTGPLLTNGKIGLQKLDNKLSSSLASTSISNSCSGGNSSTTTTNTEPICIRCKLQNENAQKLYILITNNPSHVNCPENKQKIQDWCNKMSLAVEDIRLSTQATRSILYYKVQLLAQRKRAEKVAKDLDVKISIDSIKRRAQVTKPDQYLCQLKTEFVDALMPYATYFISRFTKKDELPTAKKIWIGEMIQRYNNVKKTLKSMYSVDNEEARVQTEDKFYAALDNLRKSFDIVLTKKDIKMRRQNQSFSQSESSSFQQNEGQNDVKSPNTTNNTTSTTTTNPEDDEQQQQNKSNKVMESIEEMTTSTSNTFNNNNNNNTSLLPLVNGLNMDIEKPQDSKLDDQITPQESVSINNDQAQPLQDTPTNNESLSVSSENQKQLDQNNMDAATTRQLQEMEILARLANYPIQVEDVNALLGIANEAAEAVEESMKQGVDSSSMVMINMAGNNGGGESSSGGNSVSQQPTVSVADMELDDFRLIEENLSSGGDMDLINTIGRLGAFKGTEDADELLLNVFDDPIFSEPPEEPVPCSSRTIHVKKNHQPTPAATAAAPSLAKLTPEMCKGFLLDDIKAHQQIIDIQLDKLEAEIMELERRRGNGLKDKDDHKLFEMLYANMQIMLENTEVLHELTHNSVGLDNEEMTQEMHEAEGYEMDVSEQQKQQTVSRQNNSSESEDSDHQ